MGIERCVACSSSQTLSFSVRDVLSTSGISVSFGKPKVNHINQVLALAESNNKIVRLDIAMEEVSLVNEFNSREHLVSKHKHGFERELATTVSEKVLERRPKELHDKSVVRTFSSIIKDVGNTHSTVEIFVELGLVVKLRILALN